MLGIGQLWSTRDQSSKAELEVRNSGPLLAEACGCEGFSCWLFLSFVFAVSLSVCLFVCLSFCLCGQQRPLDNKGPARVYWVSTLLWPRLSWGIGILESSQRSGNPEKWYSIPPDPLADPKGRTPQFWTLMPLWCRL